MEVSRFVFFEIGLRLFPKKDILLFEVKKQMNLDLIS